jgi:4-hydroxy-3-polyprenylbenzoate decarboxylase
MVLPGIIVVQGPAYAGTGEMERFCEWASQRTSWNGMMLMVVVDDSAFAAATLNNWIWVTFTRSNPAADIHGIGSFVRDKHWGCDGPLVIDARTKPHHAPPLEDDPQIAKRVDALAAPGGPLHGLY